MTVGLRSLLFTLVIPGSATVWIPWLILAHRVPSNLTVPLSVRLLGGSDDCGCCALFQLPVVFRIFRTGNASRLGSASGFRFQGSLSLCQKSNVFGHSQHPAGRGSFLSSMLLAWMASGFAVGFHLFVVFYEERALKQRFGASYEHYCSQVSRWLPRLPDR